MMKKIVLAMSLVLTMNAFSLDALTASDYEIKRMTIEAIRDKDMTPVVELLNSIRHLNAKHQIRVLKAIQLGFNYPTDFVRENAEHALIAVIRAANFPLAFVVRKGTDGQWKFYALAENTSMRAKIPSYTEDEPTGLQK